MRISANLGFLWSDLPLPDAIRAAGQAGFDAVECHFPYAVDPAEVNDALKDADIPMLALNTDKADGMGLSAVPGREDEARALIDEAVNYADQIGARMVHIMAGFSEGSAARTTFIDNLRYGLNRAADSGLKLLIEPLNTFDAPGYYLSNTAQASDIISEIGSPHLRLMFDCYHAQLSEGNLTRRLFDLLPIIGHIQIAGVPDRGEPDKGEVNYHHILRHLADIGYAGDVGAEYRPQSSTDAGLDWLAAIRAQVSP